MRQVLLQLNVAAYGGNYEVLNKAIKPYLPHNDSSLQKQESLKGLARDCHHQWC